MHIYGPLGYSLLKIPLSNISGSVRSSNLTPVFFRQALEANPGAVKNALDQENSVSSIYL